MESFSAQGTWWLPGQREQRAVPGTLSFDPTSGAELSLMGMLRSAEEFMEREKTESGDTRVRLTSEAYERSGTYPRIHGVAEGKSFTLEDCFQIRSHNPFFGEDSAEVIYVNQILKGAWYDEDEELSAFRMLVRFDHFAYWVRQSGLNEEQYFAGPDSTEPLERWASHFADIIPSLTFELADGGEIAIEQILTQTGDRMVERGFKQDFGLYIRYEDSRSLGDLFGTMRSLQDLASMGLDRSAAIKSISFRHPHIYRTYGKEESRKDYLSIDYYAQLEDSRRRQAAKTLHEHDMMFTLPDIGGVQGIQRWMEVARFHRSSLNRVMATMFNRTMYVTDRLLNRAAALEAFDRMDTGYKNTEFRTRIGRCTTLAGPVFEELVHDSEEWADILCDQRNEIAHHREPIVVIATAQQLNIAECAYFLFMLCMLKRAEVPDSAFKRIKAHGRYDHLRRQLAEIISGA